ncbi:Uncharacterised protein [Salmonella enterica subsp. enterica]|uniref:Cytoplasmic protein n=1 Tax=Salmonella enterica I TaxID=59201 RepID=A0A447N5H2_SALET|nr:Uncharacterised protein [Salmonella enterica subsp. enterica]
MSENYVIEWDKNFADDLNVVANVFLSHNPTLWPTIFSQLSTPNLKSLKTKMKTNMGCRTSWIVAVAISEITSWHRHFYKFYAAKDLFTSLTGKVKMKKANWLIFSADRFYELTKNLTDSEELRNLLVEITQEDEISDVCEAGTVTLTRSLNASRPNSIRGLPDFLI